MGNLEKTIARTFLELADGLESGSIGPRPKFALTGLGSEHGEKTVMKAAQTAARRGVDVYYIGSLEAEGVTTVPASDAEEGHRKMTELLDSGAVDGAVTMHFPFPIGVSTVGRVLTPALGRELFIACTTGTSAGERVEAMVKNAVCGIITAKACGIADPTVGLLNVDGARQTELLLNELKQSGYRFTWAESARADGGAVLRGHDVLLGTPDVLVCDSLTGNVLVKLLSAYTTGGSYETVGYGYGPGIGPGYEKLVLIVSRASGAPLIANALEFGAELVRGRVSEVAEREFAAAERAGLNRLLEGRRTAARTGSGSAAEAVQVPPAEPCTASIPGIEVMDLEDAARTLWRAGIYAEPMPVSA